MVVRRPLNPLIAVVLLAYCWLVATQAVWPHTSYSGAGAERWIAALEGQVPKLDVRSRAACRPDLLEFATARAKAEIAGQYPSAAGFHARAQSAGERYIAAKCPAGPFLAMSVESAHEAAEARAANRGSRSAASP